MCIRDRYRKVLRTRLQAPLLFIGAAWRPFHHAVACFPPCKPSRFRKVLDRLVRKAIVAPRPCCSGKGCRGLIEHCPRARAILLRQDQQLRITAIRKFHTVAERWAISTN